MMIKNCAPEKCNETEKGKNHLGFVLFAEIRSSGKKKNGKGKNEAESKKRWRWGRDEHYSNLFTVGPAYDKT